MKLPNKIFNRATRIEFGTIIHRSRKDGTYEILGGRTRRKNAACILYTIPNKKQPKIPNIKGFQHEEMDNLWCILRQKEIIMPNDFRINCPSLFEEGPCCFSAFFGIINFLFPKTFNKTHGKISLIKK